MIFQFRAGFGLGIAEAGRCFLGPQRREHETPRLSFYIELKIECG
jgi:hypothetical protein